MFRAQLLLFILMKVLTANIAKAATVGPNNMSMTASVAAACNISAAGLTFTAYAGSSTTATTTISAACTNGTAYSIDLNAGTGSGATTATRILTNTSSSSYTVGYSVYTSSAYTTVCATGCISSQTGNGQTQTYTVYGKTNTTSNPYYGNYTDTLTATVNY